MVIARPAPLTMQPIVPSSLMKLMPASRASAVGRVLLVRIAQRLQLRMTGQGGIVEGDLGVEADEPLHGRAVGPGLADDGQRVDLDQVRVVGQHRANEALRDRRPGFPVRSEAHREREPASLMVEQAEVWVGMDPVNRRGVGCRNLLDLHAALRRAHQEDPARSPVQHRGQVELADDVGGRRHEHLAHRDSLDVHAEDLARDRLGLVGR